MKEWLTDFTTFRLGGPCRELATAVAAAEAAEAIRGWNAAGVPWRVMGGGSNLRVADAGSPEAVLRISSAVPDCRTEAGSIVVSAGTALDDDGIGDAGPVVDDLDDRRAAVAVLDLAEAYLHR